MKPKKYKSLTQYLSYYYQYCQKNMILVYRGETTDNWKKRCTYLGKDYHPKVPYNHRTILDCEVVIEYDYDDVSLNQRLVDKVVKKLNEDGIKYSKWASGNKSSHIHFLIRQHKVANLPLLKKAIMLYYGTFYYDKETKTVYAEPKEGRDKIVPDLKLATANHLIRAEYGVHEKTQNQKSLIYKTPEYPSLSNIPVKVFDYYSQSQERSVRQRVLYNATDVLASDTLKKLLDAVYFRKGMNDGRERIMWMLVQVLKGNYKDKPEGLGELTKFIIEWYKYSSDQGMKMSEQDIKNKVRHHWFQDYTISEAKLKEVIEEVGGSI